MTNEQEILAEIRALRADITTLMGELRAIKAIDEAVDAPNRVLLAKLNDEVTRLKERQPKAVAAASVGGGAGVIAMVIEGIRLWMGSGNAG